MTSRSWCFTTFQLKTHEKLVAISDEHLLFRFVVWQFETCPESQRSHLQGYIETKKPCRHAAIKRELDDETVHLEKRRGTRAQARAYCRKPETREQGPYERGEWTGGGQGTRSDIDGAVALLRDGGTMHELLSSMPTVFVKYTRGLRAASSIMAGVRKRERDIVTTVYWGLSGSGKTRRAIDEAGDADYYILSRDSETLWFDGYEGQDYLIIDEFYGWIKWSFFLRLLDRYPCRLPIKGGFVWANWTRIVITSNKEPSRWYERGLPTELSRRLTRSEHLLSEEFEI